MNDAADTGTETIGLAQLGGISYFAVPPWILPMIELARSALVLQKLVEVPFSQTRK